MGKKIDMAVKLINFRRVDKKTCANCGNTRHPIGMQLYTYRSQECIFDCSVSADNQHVCDAWIEKQNSSRST